MARAKKGKSQDALMGLSTPQMGGVFTATGEQSISPATTGLKPVGNLGPTNGLPGVSATLGGGETPYGVPAEAGLDMTRKQIKAAVKRAVKNANNGGSVTVEQLVDAITAAYPANDVQNVGGAVMPKYVTKQLKKVRRDPVAALSRLELLAGRLRPNDPRRLAAAGVVLKAKLVANDTAASGGSVKKVVGAIDPVEVFAALGDVEAALGISSSAAGFSPAQIAGDEQLRRIMGGQASASLRGTQDASALVGGPAAMLGQMIKAEDVDELHAAEQAVRKAEQGGDGFALSQSHERLTLARLKAAHRVTEAN